MTVTPLSKTIAMIIFIVLPVLGFFFGVRYQQKLDQPLLDKPEEITVIQKTIIITPPMSATASARNKLPKSF